MVQLSAATFIAVLIVAPAAMAASLGQDSDDIQSRDADGLDTRVWAGPDGRSRSRIPGVLNRRDTGDLDARVWAGPDGKSRSRIPGVLNRRDIEDLDARVWAGPDGRSRSRIPGVLNRRDIEYDLEVRAKRGNRGRGSRRGSSGTGGALASAGGSLLGTVIANRVMNSAAAQQAPPPVPMERRELLEALQEIEARSPRGFLRKIFRSTGRAIAGGMRDTAIAQASGQQYRRDLEDVLYEAREIDELD